MTVLNITYQGLSGELEVGHDMPLSDADVRRVATELVRAGGVPGLHLPDLPVGAFELFVVDRLVGPGGAPRLYLRPKVPFGASR
jgi:hypothetical protein